MSKISQSVMAFVGKKENSLNIVKTETNKKAKQSHVFNTLTKIKSSLIIQSTLVKYIPRYTYKDVILRTIIRLLIEL